MKRVLSLSFAVGLTLAGISSATAMTVPPAPQSRSGDIVQVAGGCGPGWHRGPYGHCIRNWVRPWAHPCARGWHLNRWGHCVRNW
jgi:hypothetical protein